MIQVELLLVVDRRVFIALLSKGHGLLPGGLPGSSGYLGREVFMAVSGRASNERRKHLYRAHNSVRSRIAGFKTRTSAGMGFTSTEV
jgi:hypothetical protein